MNEQRPDFDLRAAVIVPSRPGAVVRFPDLEHGRDDVDELLDDLFGQPDDRGPGVADAVLVAAGLTGSIGGLIGSWPGIVIALGVASTAMGLVLPIRSLWRRFASTRRSRRIRVLLGEGTVLRTGHPQVDELLAAHRRLEAAGAPLAHGPRTRVDHVGHAALLEVATLLGGHLPVTAAEVDYVTARVHALDELARTIADPRVGDGDPDRRRARVDARHEIEHITGSSSLTDASELSRELLGRDDA